MQLPVLKKNSRSTKELKFEFYISDVNCLDISKMLNQSTIRVKLRYNYHPCATDNEFSKKPTMFNCLKL